VRRIAVIVTLLGAMPLALPAGAFAQVYDDGPAGKEYAIPLDEARSKGKPGRGGSSGEDSSDRFGAGISSDPAAEEQAAPEAGAGAGQEPKGKTGAKADRDDASESEEVTPAPASSGDSGGGGGGAGADNSAALLTGGIALAVLLIGGAVALMARRTATDDV
jgi:hypothetical protein